MDDNKKCWDKNANKYDLVIKKDTIAYGRIIDIVRDNIEGKNVLEVGTGTGIIAINAADCAKEYTATDFSDKMLKAAKAKGENTDIKFERADATNLPYKDNEFDAVIISNCLHIMPYPEKALKEIKRVLTDDGILIAPNFCHKGKLSSIFLVPLKLFIGFKCYSAWRPDEYIRFIEDNGYHVIYDETINSSCEIKMVIGKSQTT